MAYKIQTGGLRLPCIKTKEDFDSLDYLNEEEKQIGLDNIASRRVISNEGWLMLGNNPELQSFWQFMESENIAMQNGDFQARPFSFMNLTNLILAKQSNNEYLWGMMVTATDASCEAHGLGQLGTVKLSMIDNPDSEIWSEEERLRIRFINAAVNNTMTDEIFQEAIDAWGEKQIIANLSWISFIWGWQMLLNSLNLKFDMSMATKRGAMSPEMIDMVVASRMPTSEQFRKFWAETSPKLANNKK